MKMPGIEIVPDFAAFFNTYYAGWPKISETPIGNGKSVECDAVTFGIRKQNHHPLRQFSYCDRDIWKRTATIELENPIVQVMYAYLP